MLIMLIKFLFDSLMSIDIFMVMKENKKKEQIVLKSEFPCIFFIYLFDWNYSIFFSICLTGTTESYIKQDKPKSKTKKN